MDQKKKSFGQKHLFQGASSHWSDLLDTDIDFSGRISREG